MFEPAPGWSLPLLQGNVKSDSSVDELLSFYQAETLSLILSLIMNVKGYALQQKHIYIYIYM